MRRVISLIIVAFVGFFLFYVSRWLRDTDKWLGVTNFEPFDLMIWAIGVFLILTLLQILFDKTGGH